MNAKATKKAEKHAGPKNLTGLMIRQCREKRGWTQYQLADSFRKMGVPVTRYVIANIETQRCPVTDFQLFFFARILGVSWKSLFPDKTILEKIVPRTIPKQNLGQSGKMKRPPRNPSREASRKPLEICEMNCKSVKITFRRSP